MLFNLFLKHAGVVVSVFWKHAGVVVSVFWKQFDKFGSCFADFRNGLLIYQRVSNTSKTIFQRVLETK